MTISANAVYEVRQGGNDLNGGGFVTGGTGTDYSQQDAAVLTVTDGNASGTTNLNSATGGFTLQMVDNILRITGGTLTDDLYQIVAFVDANNVTLDRTPGTGSGSTVRVGGAFATPGKLTNVPWVAGQKAWINRNVTSFLLTTTTPGPGGPCHLSVNGANKRIEIEGYETTRGDLGAKPIYKANGQTGLTDGIFKLSGTYGSSAHVIRNLKADGEDGAGNVGFHAAASAYYASDQLYLCESLDCPTGFKGASYGVAHRCKAISCASYGFDRLNTFDSYAKACGAGFGNSAADQYANHVNSLANACTTGFDMASSYNKQLADCIAYACTGDGFKVTTYDIFIFSRCVSYGNGGYGLNFPSSARCMFFGHNAYGGNTSGNFPSGASPLHEVSGLVLTANPFTDAANEDFTINDLAGGGAVLRGHSFARPI